MKTNKLSKKSIYIINVIFLILSQLIINLDGEVQSEDIIINVCILFVTIPLAFLVTKGYTWSKWSLGVILSLLCIACFTAGLSIPGFSFLFLAVGVYHLYFIIQLIILKEFKCMKVEDSSGNLKKEYTEDEIPTLLSRVKATFIDQLIIISFCILAAYIKNVLEIENIYFIITILVLAFSYEPFLTSHSMTIGQRIMKIRVAKVSMPSERLSIGKAFLRSFFKLILGWITFVGMFFSYERRAFHDYIVSSIVIEKE